MLWELGMPLSGLSTTATLFGGSPTAVNWTERKHRPGWQNSGTQRARDRPLFIPELYRLRVVSPCRSLPWRFRMKDGALYNIFFSPWFILPSQWVDVSLAFLFRQLTKVTVLAVVARSLLDATSAVSISSQVFPVRFSSSLSLFILLIFPLSFSLRPSVTR